MPTTSIRPLISVTDQSLTAANAVVQPPPKLQLRLTEPNPSVTPRQQPNRAPGSDVPNPNAPPPSLHPPTPFLFITPPSSFTSLSAPSCIYSFRTMPSSAATVLSPSRLALPLCPPSPTPSLLPRPPGPVATVLLHRHYRPRRIARIRYLPPSSLVAGPSTSREKSRGNLRVRFCRMTGQKKTTVDSRRASSSRATPVGPDWREFTCLPLKHMVA